MRLLVPLMIRSSPVKISVLRGTPTIPNKVVMNPITTMHSISMINKAFESIDRGEIV